MEDLIDNPPKDLFAELDSEQQGTVMHPCDRLRV